MVVQLSDVSILSGLLGLINISIAFFYGGIVLYKGLQTKEKRLYYFFLTVIFTISPWFSSAFGYLYWLFTGDLLEYEVYILVGMLGVPIALISWFQIYFGALHAEKKKMATYIITIISIFYYFYLFYFLFFAAGAPVKDLIGIIEAPNDITYKGFVLVYLFLSILITLITGLDFSRASLKARGDRSLVWRGRFLIISFILFPIGAIGDGLVELNEINLIIFRSILVASSTFFYIGFIMPKWMKKLLSLT